MVNQRKKSKMLKKSLATAVALVCIAGAAHAETVAPVDSLEVSPFGRARTYVEVDSRDGVDPIVDSGSSRIGLKAKGQSGAIGIFGELSANLNLNGGENVTTRFGYAGVSLEKLGSLSIGRQQGVQDSFTDNADIFTGAGNAAAQQMGFYASQSIKYTNEIGGIKVAALAGMDDDDAGNETVDRYEVGIGAYGFAISMGQDEGADTSYYGIGYGGKFGKVSVGASYTIADANDGGSFEDIVMFNSDDTTAVTRGIEVAAGFDVSEKVAIIGGYNLTDANGDEGVAVGELQYGLGKKAFAFANLEYDLDASEYVTRAGLQINF